ncbi:asparagine synthase C-terminal domain-containing protein [Ktedonobacter racemifer]|uniref:asparagine synthase (glutamine-hydrolyzing) n=1 Tax=Ktedonobacter racemifer DSM 44963 TaxID=485913 RepID=D6TQ55_KTERA|nr:asparagine synthase C-terminal domain-containing protein [Ktedonobacter racemifer]EFH85703.1 asparagine synthase [Ktedonobacter racemifer DSM 44963]
MLQDILHAGFAGIKRSWGDNISSLKLRYQQMVEHDQPSRPSLFSRSRYDRAGDLGIQQLYAHQLTATHQSERENRLFLAGITSSETIARLMSQHDPQSLLTEQKLFCEDRLHDLAGCWVSEEKVVLFKTETSNETPFYRRHGESLSWSTNPSDLVEPGDALDSAALTACCRGDDAFVYHHLSWVRAGTAVVLTPHSEQVFPLSKPTAAPVPHCITLEDWAALTHDTLLDALRPLVRLGQKIGVLLSGGIDSAALAAALAELGTDVVAYHIEFEHPSASEAYFAQAVCDALQIPLHTVVGSTGADYLTLSSYNAAPHPYGHPALRWFEQIAQKLASDQVHVLVTGRYGDVTFGPRESYVLGQILRDPVPLRDKGTVLLHTLSTNWFLSDIFRSIFASHSLISTRTLTTSGQTPQTHARQADFLIDCDLEKMKTIECCSDFASETTLDFSPQDLAVESIWRQYQVRAVHPYREPAIQAFAAHLPDSYRLIPYQGQKIQKPALRLAFAHRLPAAIVQRCRGMWPNAVGQQFCLSQKDLLAELLGKPETILARQGIIDQQKLFVVLSQDRFIRANYHTLIATAMVERFLQTYQKEGVRIG